MTNLIKWGNGDTILGSVEREKDFLSGSFTQQTAGIRVDWGNGDVEILTGESWQAVPFDFLVPLTVGTYTGAGRVLRRVTGQSVIWFDFEGTVTFQTRCDIPSHYVFKVNGGWFARSSSSFSSCGSPTYSYPIGNTEFYSRCQAGNLEGGYNFSDSTGGIGKRITVNPCGYKVTTNTGQVSQRSTSTPPNVTIQTGNCILKITYTDNSLQRESLQR
jgi:hypothetical protein